MQQPQITSSCFDFLNQLKANNNRLWFEANKDNYQQQLAIIEQFAGGLLAELNKHDVIETLSGKKSLRRIYRDVRFSLNKAPYKIGFSGGFKRATKYRRGGYFFRLQPGNSFIAGGFQAPNPADLKLIREDIAFDPAPLRNIITSEPFIATFGSLKGEQIFTTPKGFKPDDEAIDLLRYKQFLLVKPFTDAEVLSPGFIHQANETYKNMRPFFDYMSDVLSTDINGERI